MKHIFKASIISAVSVFFITATSCGSLPAAYYEPDPFSLIPGECLNDTKLECIYAAPKGEHYDTGPSYAFIFKVDMSIKREKLKHFTHGTSWRWAPNDSVFQQYGSNSSAIKKEYEILWESMRRAETTIYLNDGLSLIADRDFGGLPAGANLASLCSDKYFVERIHQGESCVPLPEGVLSDPRCALHSFDPNTIGWKIWNDDYKYEQVDGETVNFILTVPVRVVYCLTWLNDKLTDENAPMTWKDEVLTCSFTSQTGWRLKE